MRPAGGGEANENVFINVGIGTGFRTGTVAGRAGVLASITCGQHLIAQFLQMTSTAQAPDGRLG